RRGERGGRGARTASTAPTGGSQRSPMPRGGARCDCARCAPISLSTSAAWIAAAADRVRASQHGPVGFSHLGAAPRHDGQDARVDISTLVGALRAGLADALVAVDFDGTLAPIVPDPADSRPAPRAVAALRTTAARG